MAEAPSEGAVKSSMRSGMAWGIFGLVVVLIVILLMRLNLTALPEPGHVETRAANLAKRVLIYRASRQAIPPRPLDIKASVDNALQQRSSLSSRWPFTEGLSGNPKH